MMSIHETSRNAPKTVVRFHGVFRNLLQGLIATFRVARQTLQTRKLKLVGWLVGWLVGVATDRDARYLRPARM